MSAATQASALAGELSALGLGDFRLGGYGGKVFLYIAMLILLRLVAP